MSSDLKILTYFYSQIISIKYMYKQDLVINNLKLLTHHSTQQTIYTCAEND